MEILEVGHKSFIEGDNSFYLLWSVTNSCNFHCDYCGVHKPEKFSNKDQWVKAVKYINFIANNHTMEMVLFGGEPTLHPSFLEIVRSINCDIRMVTNLSMNIEFYKKLVGVKDNLILVCSYHYLHANKEKYMETVKFLLDHVCRLRIKIMWDSRFKQEILDIFFEFKELEKQYSRLFVFLDIVYSETCGGDWSADDLEYFESLQTDHNSHIVVIKDDNNNVIKKDITYNLIRRLQDGFPNYYLYNCDCGKSGVYINSNGDVHYCLTMGMEGRTPIFNVFNDDFLDYSNILNTGIICKEKGFCCECTIPKKRLPDKIRDRLK